ncbi:carbohydrate kinase family protein [Deinococcus sp. KSM4-11]|uniref:carbohydrate kinase family protein n=1 Tax=Deinococcus sp. KSM4-11 TaxID=2568654 RepID=UPI0010A429D0|nr:carbohydrate kinase family protein [Deinococcus sp. KSM4-11]THF88896.1 carbohydrate kinase family protein [Deinococcus sp. KSM4-11]
MTRPLLVCGNANLETVLGLEGEFLPVQGDAVTDRLSVNVSGVGVNLVRGLSRLGSPVRFVTLLGNDVAGRTVRQELDGIEWHAMPVRATAQTLALVRPDGRHTFYRDIKGNEQADTPVAAFRAALPGCGAALLTNIGWTRDLLPVARAAGVPIQTDVHEISSVDAPYDQPYLDAADVLLFSAARLTDPAGFLLALRECCRAHVIIAGLGEGGALLLERGADRVHHQPAFRVVATHRGGAGDALAAAFAHFLFTRGHDPREALRLACAAAALKLRGKGSGEGHATEAEVRALAG